MNEAGMEDTIIALTVCFMIVGALWSSVRVSMLPRTLRHLPEFLLMVLCVLGAALLVELLSMS